jgi:hypothetical protein
VSIAFVHGAFAAGSAAGHARFSGCQPPGADRGVPGRQAERERESRETLDEPHHLPRMLDRRGGVKRTSAQSTAIPAT